MTKSEKKKDGGGLRHVCKWFTGSTLGIVVLVVLVQLAIVSVLVVFFPLLVVKVFYVYGLMIEKYVLANNMVSWFNAHTVFISNYVFEMITQSLVWVFLSVGYLVGCVIGWGRQGYYVFTRGK